MLSVLLRLSKLVKSLCKVVYFFLTSPRVLPNACSQYDGLPNKLFLPFVNLFLANKLKPHKSFNCSWVNFSSPIPINGRPQMMGDI